jgi:hypothetical protein
MWHYIYVSVELYLHRWETNYWTLFRQIMSSVVMGRQSVRAYTESTYTETRQHCRHFFADYLTVVENISNVSLNSEAVLKSCQQTVSRPVCSFMD